MKYKDDQQWFVTFENGAHFLSVGPNEELAKQFALEAIRSIASKRADYDISPVLRVELATKELFKKYYGETAFGWKS